MKSLSLEQPHAIVMVGIPGSGKTFFAQKFADTFHAPFLEQAILEQYVTDETVIEGLVNHFITEFIKTKQSIVLEVDTDSRARRSELARQLKSSGYTPLFVWVQTDADAASMRTLKTRGMSVDEHFTRYKRFSPPHSSEHALVISGKHTYASQAKIILKKLSAPRANISTHRIPPARGKIIVR